jgi:hypothetical protein
MDMNAPDKDLYPKLWATHIETDLTEQNIRGFQALGIKFFGLFRQEEYILGHKILETGADEATMLLITRRYDYSQSLEALPGVNFEISSSIGGERVEDYREEIVALEGVMKTLDPNYQPTEFETPVA